MVKRWRWKILCLVAIITIGLISTQVYAAYESTEFVKVTRSNTSGFYELNQVMQVNYQITSDKLAVSSAATSGPKDIMLVCDASNSMLDSINGETLTAFGGRSKISYFKEAAKKFVDKFKGQDVNIGITKFGEDSYEPGNLLSVTTDSNISTLKTQIDTIRADTPWDDSLFNMLFGKGKGTNIGDGMRRAYYELVNNGRAGAAKYLILMTDGEPNYYTLNDSILWFGGNGYKTSDGKAEHIYHDLISIFTENKGMTYSRIIGGIVKANTSIKSFVVGYESAWWRQLLSFDSNNLAYYTLGKAMNSFVNPNTNYPYFKAARGEDMVAFYEYFAEAILGEYTIKSATFNETLPLGVEPILDDLKINYPNAKYEIQTDGRYKVIIPGLNLKLVKGADGTFQLNSEAITLRVKFTSTGDKEFVFNQGYIDYIDPFGNTKKAVITGGATAKVGIPVTSVGDLNDLKVQMGSTESVTVSINPADATYVKYKWDVVDDTVIKLKDIQENTDYSYNQSGAINLSVEGLKVGSTKLKLTVYDEMTEQSMVQECTVNVGVPVGSVSEFTDAKIIKGETQNLVLTLTPPEASDVQYIINIGNENIALDGKTVGTPYTYDQSGKVTIPVTGLQTGTSELTVIVKDNFTGTSYEKKCNIEIVEMSVTIPEKVDINRGKEKDIIVGLENLINPVTCEISILDEKENIVDSSSVLELMSSKSVTMTSDGNIKIRVKGLAAGKAGITIKVTDPISHIVITKTCKVYVFKPDIQ